MGRKEAQLALVVVLVTIGLCIPSWLKLFADQ